MRRWWILLNLIFLLSLHSLASGQNDAKEIQLSKKAFSITVGNGLFQQVRMELLNFDNQIIATSGSFIPLNFKANFHYYFTPKLALRFSSGYGFFQSSSEDMIDYGILHMQENKIEEIASFSVTGFPAELAVLFQAPLDVRANMFFHFGLGIGYYAYNYQAEGTLKQFNSKTKLQLLKENYINPEMTLSGFAQFFLIGFDLSLNNRLGAMIEISKAGLGRLKLTRDIVKQEVSSGKIVNETKYGVSRQDYPFPIGLDDIAISFGLIWQL
ncbi:MAG: hypothetical protein ONB16_01025 [candidate division KSB1 bacterium]|nr:hypothetical protein [candidate division KSB1 bacterium]MDZ7317929.1 hypothetical protein [candidate division KSB1 bacterium]MDZ7340700.1 hypothetical protein [candidate division KSB1 bacterium]